MFDCFVDIYGNPDFPNDPAFDFSKSTGNPSIPREDGVNAFDVDQGISDFVISKISYYLSAIDLGSLSITDKQFNKVISISNKYLLNALDLRILFPSSRIIDKNIWEENLGKKNLDPSFGRQASFNQDLFKALKEISSLPTEGNAEITLLNLSDIVPPEDFTLNKCIEIAESIGQEINIEDEIKDQFGDVLIDLNRTVLLTNNVIQGSRNISFDKQKKMVEEFGYELPEISYVLIAAIFAYLIDQASLYPKEPPTFTRCSNMFQLEGEGIPIVVGSFFPNRISIIGSPFDKDHFAIAAQWKLKAIDNV